MVWYGGSVGKGVGWNGSQFLILRKAYISNMSLLLGPEPFQKFVVGGWVGGGWVGVKLDFSVTLWAKP